jgi:hypothetical protein
MIVLTGDQFTCLSPSLTEVREKKSPRRLDIDSAELFYHSPDILAERWGCSTDKVNRVLEGYRGESGFMDLGNPEDVRAHKRRYSIIRIHPDLLKQIESDLARNTAK